MTAGELALQELVLSVIQKRTGIIDTTLPGCLCENLDSAASSRDELEVVMLASGSTGNATFIHCGRQNILIDAGISFRRIDKGLQSLGYTVHDLDGIFITHEHSDHISAIPMLLKKTDLPIYTTKGTWQAMGEKVSAYEHRFVQLCRRNIIGNISVNPFSISHDAVNPVGYTICGQGKKITLATELGFVTDEVRVAMDDSDILILEANHDVQMLQCGPYPPALRNRVLSNRGHLSNEGAGWALANMKRSAGVQVILAHRSQNNNTPKLVWDTVTGIVRNNGIVVGADMMIQLAQEQEMVKCIVKEEDDL